MPNQAKKYTLLWIPSTGLMHEGGRFFDGNMRPIQWDRVIRIFRSHARAEVAKKRILDRYPDAQGDLVTLSVEIEEVPE
jgi:hypothetical protein